MISSFETPRTSKPDGIKGKKETARPCHPHGASHISSAQAKRKLSRLDAAETIYRSYLPVVPTFLKHFTPTWTSPTDNTL
eukprot:scaffold39813_cov206-Amphora_coffeaeformis.AAC.2